MADFDLFHGDLLTVLPTWEENSVDAVVCDPPYGLSFLGKNWDHNVPGPAYWREIFRVLKPGGHLLAFGGSRTFHRMFCAIEDAGFEVRDTLMWVYGSGFPKSLDVSKALDKAADTADLARQWNGWGTALKPSHEPICMARKPLEGTVAQNVAKWGVGALNIDGCRVASVDGHKTAKKPTLVRNTPAGFGKEMLMGGRGSPLGRWPANLIHDGSDEVVSLFPAQAGGGFGVRGARSSEHIKGKKATYETVGFGDSGSAARFFYGAKTSQKDRGKGNPHPTVKPTDLMRYLCRMVTPPGGTVLDPFMGSGSTGKGALLEGFNFLGIEREKQYIEVATARLNAVLLEEVK